MSAGPTLAQFQVWLNAEQQRAMDGMHASEGEAFSAHLAVFAQVSGAISEVLRFNYAQFRDASVSTIGGAA